MGNIKNVFENIKVKVTAAVSDKNFWWGALFGALLIGFITWNDSVKAVVETVAK